MRGPGPRVVLRVSSSCSSCIRFTCTIKAFVVSKIESSTYLLLINWRRAIGTSQEWSGEEGVHPTRFTRGFTLRLPLASLPDSRFARRIFFRSRREPVRRLTYTPIESRESWMPAQNGRLAWVGGGEFLFSGHSVLQRRSLK